MASKRLVFSPNTKIVKVYQNDDREVTFHEVLFSLDGYIRKCKEDKKVATYVGTTNEKGEIDVEF